MSRLGACDELDGIGEEWSDEGRGHRQNALLCGDALVPGRGDTPVGDVRALPPVARLRDLLPRGGRPPRDPGGGAALPAGAVDIRGGDSRRPGCRGAVGLHARRGGAPRADGRGSGGGRRAGCRMHERGRGAGRAADDAVLAVPQTRPGPSSTAENQAPKGLKHAEPSSFEGNTMGEYLGHGESVNLSPRPPRRVHEAPRRRPLRTDRRAPDRRPGPFASPPQPRPRAPEGLVQPLRGAREGADRRWGCAGVARAPPFGRRSTRRRCWSTSATALGSAGSPDTSYSAGVTSSRL